MTFIIKKVRQELKHYSNEETKLSGQRFFKEKIKSYGVKIPIVNNIAKENFKTLKTSKKEDIFLLCEELWQSGYIEESFIACSWSYSTRKYYKPNDFKLFEKWISNYINNWASCDTFCNHTIGSFIEMYPEYIKELKKWTSSTNRWMKRASAVSLIVPAKKGLFLTDIFEIADALLLDKDDLVQKGYGWMLKAASKEKQKEVFNYIIKKKNTMPRTALRYAIEKMPIELKKKAMKK